MISSVNVNALGRMIFNDNKLVKIRDIEFPESVLIGGLIKNGEFVKPSGGTLIEEGDTIALFTMAEDIPEVERLLQVSIDFF